MRINQDIVRKALRESISIMLNCRPESNPSIDTYQEWLEKEVANNLARHIKKNVEIKIKVSQDSETHEIFNVNVTVSDENEFRI